MAANRLFTGIGTALVTPFTADNEVDEETLRRLIDRQIEHDVDALVILGTTGENATVSPGERERIVETAIEHTDGRVPVIIGSGNNSTSESITFSKQATSAGADGLLVVGPYYNKPTQGGFRAHVAAIAEVTDCPIIVYNVPSRTSFNVEAETMLQLAEEVPAVVAVKEASGNLAQISTILAHRPSDLAVYAGDDEIALPLLSLGADGVISVISNALPARFGQLIRAGLDGDFETARALQFELQTAMRACFYETNPIPIKAVLADAGLMEEQLRLPLVRLQEANRERVRQAFTGFDELDLSGAA